MGPRDAGGVVGARLVVHGAKNLRVVDASCFPLIPRGEWFQVCMPWLRERLR